MRAAAAGLVALFLAVCVLLGTWVPVYWHLEVPLWAELAIAAAVGLAAGALAPHRALPAWLAWPILIALAWAAYAYGAIAIMAPSMVARFLVFPLSASVGVAAGLAAWRMTGRGSVSRLAPIAFGAAAVVGIFFLHGAIAAWSTPAPWRAPAFNLALLKGGRVSSEALMGKTVVLAFWASWCAPCRKELPALQKLYRTLYASRENIRFYFLDEGGSGETPAKARAFLARLSIEVPAAYDANGRLLRELRGLGVLPMRVVIGPRGRVRLSEYGYLASDAGFPKLRRAITESLAR
jgi:thiol-disulfide isomerase/thioredoxin